MYQLGGIDPLMNVPVFKYTFNEPRKLLVGTIYPYGEYFLNLVITIPFNSYSYNGEIDLLVLHELKDPNDSSISNEYMLINCQSVTSPQYNLVGGCVYEIINKKYKNIDLHKYCDPTSDIDVSVYPPKLKYISDKEFTLNFLNRNKEINSFYEHFSSWIFNQMKIKLSEMEQILNKISPSIVEFDIDEYCDIPETNKKSN
jgi:hypothetical protein